MVFIDCLFVLACLALTVTGNFCTVAQKFKQFEKQLEAYLSDKDCNTGHQHKDCSTILEFPEVSDGVFTLHPLDGGPPVRAFCQMTRRDGAWLVIQRNSGNINFNRTWKEYQHGFGHKENDFWLGNDALTRVTNQGYYELQIEMVNSDGQKGVAHYDEFEVGTMKTFYQLHVSGYKGNIGDTLSINEGMRFSAYDFDLDRSSQSCASEVGGGWWFKDCIQSDLNINLSAVNWSSWNHASIKSTLMKIRPNTNICKGLGTAPHPKCNPYDCREIKQSMPNAPSGVYEIHPRDGGPTFQAFCDMTTDGGGWLVFQKRFDGSVDFYRGWNEYRDGFGSLNAEFWLGLEKIRRLTNLRTYEIRFDLVDWNNTHSFATFKTFRLSGGDFKLNISGYSGPAGDPFKDNTVERPFRTKDSTGRGKSCAVRYHGAWWYDDCHRSNLNGKYNSTEEGVGLNWHPWHGYNTSLKETQIKIRPSF